MFGYKADETTVQVVAGHTTPVLLLYRAGKWGMELSDRGVQVWFGDEATARKNYQNYASQVNLTGSRPGNAKRKKRQSRRNMRRMCVKQQDGNKPSARRRH